METASYPPPAVSPAADTSFPPLQPVARKIAILGFGETVKECPWQDPSWELWGMNGFWRAAEPDFGIKAPEDRYSAWFDMHTVEYTRVYGKKAGFGDKQERWLEQEHPFPVLMLDADPKFPSVVRFPIEELVAGLGRDYFTSTVAYAIAFAMSQEGVAEIGMWGIDLVHSTEYAEQRPCAEYWIGRAEAAGIKVTIHPSSALLRQRFRYGYEGQDPCHDEMVLALQGQITSITRGIEKNQEELQRLQGQLLTDNGALQMAHEMLARLDAWRRGGRI